MSRVEYKNWAVDSAGTVIGASAVELRRKSDNALATLYTAATGATTKTNPFSAEADGSFSFFVEPGLYDLTLGTAPTASTVPLDLQPWHFVTLERFGAVGDGSTDDTAAWVAANDYLEGLGGGRILLAPNTTYAVSVTTLANNVICEGRGGSAITMYNVARDGGNWIENRDQNLDADGRVAHDLGFRRVKFISTRLYERWLSQADGTPVTNPEADYVAGTGALASGITGVNLTAVLSGDAVASVTVVAGGSGWNGHPTHPYAPSTVPLKFTGGGGSGAKGYATISGGTITGVTIEYGGTGYTSAPVVTTMGGYADISLLVDPSVDRRNPNLAANWGIKFVKVLRPVCEDCEFVNFKSTPLADQGCKDGSFKRLKFSNCGKSDGAFPAIWSQSNGNPASPATGFADSEASVWDGLVFENCERSAMMISPTKGGTVRNFTVDGYGESCFFLNGNLNYNGGRLLIENGDISGGQVTDIASDVFEGDGAKRVTVRDVRVVGSPLSVTKAVGAQDCLFDNLMLENIGTGAAKDGDLFYPYGPFSERYSYNVGQRPIAGQAIAIENIAPHRLGTFAGTGMRNVRYRGGYIKDDRAVQPAYLFSLEKTGGDSLSDTVVIEDIDVSGVAASTQMIDTSVSNVFKAEIPLWIRNNPGHASEAPVVTGTSIASGSTGVAAVDVGFRPSRVTVYASNNNKALGQMAVGEFTWKRSGTNDFAVHSNSIGGYAELIDDEVLRLKDNTDTTVFSMEFTAWSETGFSYNVITSTQTVRLRFVCHP